VLGMRFKAARQGLWSGARNLSRVFQGAVLALTRCSTRADPRIDLISTKLPEAANPRRRHVPAIDSLIHGIPLDAEVDCHFNDGQPTILHNLLFCCRHEREFQCGLLSSIDERLSPH
jgi:hypothetical protein